MVDIDFVLPLACCHGNDFDFGHFRQKGRFLSFFFSFFFYTMEPSLFEKYVSSTIIFSSNAIQFSLKRFKRIWKKSPLVCFFIQSFLIGFLSSSCLMLWFIIFYVWFFKIINRIPVDGVPFARCILRWFCLFVFFYRVSRQVTEFFF